MQKLKLQRVDGMFLVIVDGRLVRSINVLASATTMLAWYAQLSCPNVETLVDYYNHVQYTKPC